MLKIKLLLVGIICAMHSYAQEAYQVESNSFPSKSLSISTNVPTWLIGIPSLGIAYKPSDRSEILVDGSFSHWNFKRDNTPHYWRSWNVSPQVRRYINDDRSTYLGLQYSVGQYNISAQQGKYMGGGISFGKQYYLAKDMLIDLGLTLGYLRFRDRASYTYSNEVFYTNHKKKDSNYWGPTAVSIKLIKKIN